MEEMHDSDHCPSVSPLVLLPTSSSSWKNYRKLCTSQLGRGGPNAAKLQTLTFFPPLLFSFCFSLLLFSHIQLPQPTPSYLACLSQALTSSPSLHPLSLYIIFSHSFHFREQFTPKNEKFSIITYLSLVEQVFLTYNQELLKNNKKQHKSLGLYN